MIAMAEAAPTGRELEALKVLWARGKATVRAIYRELRPAEGEGELAYTTVLSLLQTMEQKGLVGHELEGKAYAYFAKVERAGVVRSMAGGFLERVFDGALGEYVERALQSKRPSLAELEEIERMIAAAKREAKARPESESEGGRA